MMEDSGAKGWKTRRERYGPTGISKTPKKRRTLGEGMYGSQLGRPRKTGGTQKTRKLREQRRAASARYYEKNREEILRRVKEGWK